MSKQPVIHMHLTVVAQGVMEGVVVSSPERNSFLFFFFHSPSRTYPTAVVWMRCTFPALPIYDRATSVLLVSTPSAVTDITFYLPYSSPPSPPSGLSPVPTPLDSAETPMRQRSRHRLSGGGGIGGNGGGSFDVEDGANSGYFHDDEDKASCCWSWSWSWLWWCRCGG